MATEEEEDKFGQRSIELCQRFWKWRLVNFPEFATSVGEFAYDDKLTDMSLNGFQRRFNESSSILNEVNLLAQSFRENNFSCTNIDVLQFELSTFVDGFRYHSYLCPVSNLEGPHIMFHYLLCSMSQETENDYDNILSRLRLLSTQVDDMIALMREGIRRNITLHAYSVYQVINQLRDMLDQPINESPLFRTFLTRPANIPEQKWTIITEQGTRLIQLQSYPAFEKLSKFLDSEYLAHTRDKISVISLPSGEDFYCACLQYHTSTDLTPVEIHTIGLKEVERIQNRMKDLLQEMEFHGSYVDLINQLCDDIPSHQDGDIVEGYSVIYDNILKELPSLFNSLPSKKCEIKTMQSKSYGGGFYRQGNRNQPGTFWINTDEITSITFKSNSLALHEMIPGHHLQKNIMLQKLDIPKFRKFRESGNYYIIPGRFPLYTSFVEGWAMYAEHLGEALGTYKTPLDLLGRLCNEIFRAARLVVDTGIHAFNWQKEQAVNYMMEIVGMRREFVSSEVDRYITWPGQACSYKIGELKIMELRDMASRALGEKFDLNEFHDLILHTGEVPFELIERNIELYIKSKTLQ